MTTAQPQQQSRGGHRHHPYASSSASSSSSSRQAPISQTGRKWTQSSANVARHPSPELQAMPPSPPRSRRDHSESPPVGLGAAFGGRGGGKWWDEELPQPPASLSSILESFRRSGEGDRDLLLAILGAKKAEEERLTSLIQTRLTILQARLSVHAASAEYAAPTPTETTSSPRGTPLALLPERTPSLTSRASGSSSSGLVSPGDTPGGYMAYDPRDTYTHPPSLHLPPPSNFWRKSSHSAEFPPLRATKQEPGSPGSDHSGLAMLLDAGRRVERE